MSSLSGKNKSAFVHTHTNTHIQFHGFTDPVQEDLLYGQEDGEGKQTSNKHTDTLKCFKKPNHKHIYQQEGGKL